MSRITLEIHTPNMAVIEVAAKKFGFKNAKAFIAETAVFMARIALLTAQPEEDTPRETDHIPPARRKRTRRAGVRRK